MTKIMEWLRDWPRADAILTNGAGNYPAWLYRLYQYRLLRSRAQNLPVRDFASELHKRI